MTASIDRYDSRAAGGPIRSALSAARTWSASASASEWMAIGEMPSSRQARITRMAISPRFAISRRRKGGAGMSVRKDTVAQSGMLPCFFGGTDWRLFSSIASAPATRARVSDGRITSST